MNVLSRFLLSTFLFCLSLNGLGQSVSYPELFDRIKHNPSDTTTVNTFLEKIKKDDAETDLLTSKAEKFYSFVASTNCHKHVARVAIFIASKYNNIGRYSQALKYEIIAEKRLKKIPLTHLLGTTYSIMGNTYLALKNDKKQKESFENCYNIGVELKDQMTIAVGATGLGNYYSSITDYTSSNNWNYKALTQFDAINNHLASGIIRVNIAANYRRLNQMDRAKKTLQDAEKNVLLSDNNYSKSGYYQEVGDQLTVEKNTLKPLLRTKRDSILY